MPKRNKVLILATNPSDLNMPRKKISERYNASELKFIDFSNLERSDVASPDNSTNTLGNYDVDLSKLNDDCIQMIKSWRKLKTEGKRIDEILTYKGIPLFEIVEYELLLVLRNVIMTLDSIHKIINIEKPAMLVVIEDDTFPYTEDTLPVLTSIAKIVAQKRKISIRILKPKMSSCLKKSLVPIFWRIKDLLKFARTLQRALDKKKKEHKKQLFIVGCKNHVDISKKVIDLLKDKPKIIRCDGIFNPVRNALKKAKFRFSNFESYLDRGILMNQHSNKSRFSKLWKTIRNDEKVHNHFTYREYNIFDALKNTLDYYFRFRFKDLCFSIDISEKILLHEKPKIVVVMMDKIPPGNVFVNAAKKLKIPTLVIQHGMIVDPYGYSPIESSKIATWGNISKNLLVEYGTPEKKIVITGNPAFDAGVFGGVGNSINDIYKELKMKKSKYVLFTATCPYTLDWKLIKWTINAMKKFPHMKLVIKLHPGEILKPDKILEEDVSNQAIVTKDTNILFLLKYCNALVTQYSTTGLEAIFFDKPIISIKPKVNFLKMDYLHGEVASFIETEEELASALEGVLHNRKKSETLKENRKKFIGDSLYRLDGKAAERIVHLIKSMSR